MFKVADLHGSADKRHSGTGDPSNAAQPNERRNGKASSISSMRKELAKLDRNGDGEKCVFSSIIYLESSRRVASR